MLEDMNTRDFLAFQVFIAAIQNAGYRDDAFVDSLARYAYEHIDAFEREMVRQRAAARLMEADKAGKENRQ